MRLLGVKSLNRDIPEGGGALPEPARRRLLLQGANGSGKSTILETILTLWRFWGEWTEAGPGAAPPKEHLNHFLANAQLAAIEFVGIPNLAPLWIGLGDWQAWKDLRKSNTDAIFAMLGRDRIKFTIPPLVDWQIALPVDDMLTRRHRSLAGSELFPNVVYFPAEGRTIRQPEKPRGEIIDTTQFNWTAVYDSGLDLDSILLTVQALSPERFSECLRLVNLALSHRQKRITGFGQRGRLLVEGKSDSGVAYKHFVEDLSSGEKQMLLLVAFVVAFLRPGGIVLLDEPDLHIHLAMVDQLLETLERVVQERKGQLIVASHSIRVWDWFARPEEQIDLSSWKRSNA
jgi:hypothetical protein